MRITSKYKQRYTVMVFVFRVNNKPNDYKTHISLHKIVLSPVLPTGLPLCSYTFHLKYFLKTLVVGTSF